MKKKNDLSYNPYKGKDPLAIRDNFKFFKGKKSILMWEGNGYEHPLITIAIPTYKAELLKLAIQSSVNQKGFENFEVLIVDNNVDTWHETLSYIKDLNNPHIRYYRNEENIGLVGNWNRCLELARGEYFVFCHADDMLEPDTLKNLWDFHQSIEPEAAILGRSRVLDMQGNLIKQFQNKRRYKGLLPALPYYKLNKRDLYSMAYDNGVGELIKVSCAREIGGWNPDAYPAIDMVFFMNYHRKFGCYRLNKIIRTSHFGLNNSIDIVDTYASTSYHIKMLFIDKYYDGNLILKIIEKIRLERANIWSYSGVQVYQPLWYKLFARLYFFVLNFRIK